MHGLIVTQDAYARAVIKNSQTNPKMRTGKTTHVSKNVNTSTKADKADPSIRNKSHTSDLKNSGINVLCVYVLNEVGCDFKARPPALSPTQFVKCCV